MLRLQLHRNPLDRFFVAVLSLLSRSLQTWIIDCTRRPDLALPPNIILKKRKEGWDEEFENEKDMYTKLKPVQGRWVPICYGEVHCDDNLPALVLSDIGGFALYTPEAAYIAKNKFEEMFRQVFEAIGRLGIIHSDIKLDNYHLVDSNRIMVVDIEAAEEIDMADIEYSISTAIPWLWKQYKSQEECLRDDAFLE